MAELSALCLAAAESPRRRAHRELHDGGATALSQRFLAGFLRGSYFRAHCHAAPHKTELTVAVAGACDVLLFDEDGVLLQRQRLGVGGAVLLQIPPNTWHAIAAIEEFAALLEVKQGPYDAATDKLFADWAPEEGTAGAAECELWLRSAALGERFI